MRFSLTSGTHYPRQRDVCQWLPASRLARALLEQLGAEILDLPAYDPAKYEKFPWEGEVAAAIDELRAENEAEKPAEDSAEEQRGVLGPQSLAVST